MGKFDDIVEKGQPKTFNSERKAAPAGEPINILELLEGPDSPFSEVVSKMNPEMKSKVIVPLAGLLDKYGLGETLSASPTATNAVGLVSIIGDIAPVIQGLAEFVSGQKNSLAKDDKAFLEEIMRADESGEFSDLFNEIGESVEDKPPAKMVHPLIGELPTIDLESGPVDWMKVLDPNGTVVEKNEKKSLNLEAYEELVPKDAFKNQPKIKMPTLEELAAAAGTSMDTLKKEDSNIRPDDEPMMDITSDDFDTGFVESIMDMDSIEDIYSLGGDEDEIIYLSDEEVIELEAQGHELEEINNDDE